VTRRVG